jgi:adenylate cyclase
VVENPAVPDFDFEGEGLLEGLEGEARGARLALLHELADDGVSLEELREAVAAGRLALLPVERALVGDGPRYTARQIAERAGVELADLQRISAALGVPNPDPDQQVLGEADLEAAKRYRAFRDMGLPEEGMLQVQRAIGRATAQIAQANRELIVNTLIQPGDNERDLALRLAAAARALMPLVGPSLAHAMQVQLLEQVRRDVIGQADLEAGAVGGATDVSVCFADMVGFTKLGERIAIEELGLVAGRLEEMATSVAESPVRLVKLIGDAAMLVSREPEALVEAALRMVDAADEEGERFPQLRAGVAFGPALGRGGDFYGRPVNLASRITGVARPGSVLASEEAVRVAGDDFSYSFAGERRLKGIDGQVRLFRVRREPKGASR